MESAGFAKNNPYYVVKQGKVMELTSMNDKQRLNLLRNVSGVATFDASYDEATKNLQNVKERQVETQAKFDMISKRMEELE